MRDVLKTRGKGKPVSELDDATLNELLAEEKKLDKNDRRLALYSIKEFKEELNADLDTLIEKNRREFDEMFRAYREQVLVAFKTGNTAVITEINKGLHDLIQNEV